MNGYGGGRFEPYIPEAAAGEYSLVNGSLDPVFFTGFNGNVIIDMGDGAETLSLDLLHSRNVTVKFGTCPDGAVTTLSSNSMTVCGNYRVEKCGTGKVYTTIASSEIRGNLSIDGGSQYDPVGGPLSGVYLSQLAVHGNVRIDGGGEDVLVELSTICGNLRAETGNYSTSLRLDQLTVDGNVSVDLGPLNDFCQLSSLTVDGHVSADLGSGDDTLEVLSSAICGFLHLDGGSGFDSYVIDSTTYRRLHARKFESTTP